MPKAKIAAWPKATAEQTARAAAITPPPIQTGGVHQTERVHYVFNAPVRQRRMPAKPTEATRTVAVKHARGRSITVKHARGGSIVKMIEAMAPQYGVPTWFALRIAKVESGYNPNARGSHGELGVFQMKCATARGIGYNGGCEGLLNAHTGIQYGLKHLSLALKSSRGNLRLAASKHNGGLGRRTLVPTYVAQVF
ncbi:MAG TPA: transglycosylase SLT domain-containing protein [Aestuariivirga sp.]|nr:transglycosylase SLT domain-containing protein [Aestuariivirga sp.]